MAVNIDHTAAGSATIVASSSGTATLTLPNATGTFLYSDANGNANVAGSVVMGSSFLRNRVINGDMRIDQRNNGASVNGTDGTFSVDRWICYVSQASKFTMQQNAGSVTPPSGFKNYLGITVGASASVTIGASDYFVIQQSIEGYNVSDFGFGAAGASTFTISFWVRSSVTGTYGGSFKNKATSADRSYPFTYTIVSANTWEKKTITVAGDTSGTWLFTNGTGICLCLSLGAGSTFSGTAGSWAAANYLSATSTATPITTNSATFYLTGVQLEVGTIATSFERQIYSAQLQQCQRYYQQLASLGAGNFALLAIGNIAGSLTGYAGGYFRVSMRAAPTFSYSGTLGTDIKFQTNGIDATPSTIGSDQMNPDTWSVSLTGTSLTAGNALRIFSLTTSGIFKFSAEL